MQAVHMYAASRVQHVANVREKETAPSLSWVNMFVFTFAFVFAFLLDLHTQYISSARDRHRYIRRKYKESMRERAREQSFGPLSMFVLENI